MKSAIIRYLIVFLVFAVIIFGVLYWIGKTEQLAFTGFDKSISISAQMAFLAFIAYNVIILMVWTLLRFLWDLPHRIKTGSSRRKQGKALEALEDAMIAASAGDADKARKKATRARSLINRPALAQIVSAQAAEVSGDPAEAETQYTAMLDDDKTRRIAQRGLATLAYTRGDMSNAISYAQQAYADNKDAKWAFDVLFNAYITDGQWEQALATLESGERRKHVTKDIARRRRAAIMSAHASQLANVGKRDAASSMAVEAASLDPGFAPSVALAARLLVQSGSESKAGKLIEKAWAKSPHPALAFAYRDLKTGESPKARAKRLKGLMKQNSSHRETILLSIEESLHAGDGVKAWGELRALTDEETPSGRVCELAASAEMLCANHADARLWKERAVTAPVEPNWSDLDPNGPAFEYTDNDWRRLIHSYGDSGELIHPRHERFEAVRPAVSLAIIGASDMQAAPDNASDAASADEGQEASNITAPEEVLTPPSADDPGVGESRL